MKRICQICSVLPPGGDAVGEGAIKLKRLLGKNDFYCCILTSSDQQPGNDILNIIDNWSLFQIIKSIRIIKKKEIDIIYFHYPTPYYKRKLVITFIPLIFRIFGFATVTYLHEYHNYSLLGKLRILPILIFSDRIVTSDTPNFNSINELIGKYKRIIFASVGSNFSDEFILKNKTNKTQFIGLTNSKINLLYFGFIMEGKGLETMIELSESKEFTSHFIFTIAGGLPEIMSFRSKEIYSKVKSSKNINYLGFITNDKLSEIFAKTDAVILPFNDGVTERRGSFLTCMALGKAVVTTQPKVSFPGLINLQNVLFLENLSKEEVLRKVEYIRSISRSKLKEIGNAAHDWYMQNFSEKIFVDKIISVINSL